MNTKQKLFKQITGYQETYNMHLQGPGDEDLLQAAKDGDFDYVMKGLRDYPVYDYIENENFNNEVIERKHGCSNADLAQVAQAVIDYITTEDAEKIYDSLMKTLE